MNVLLLGGTGAMGKALVPALARRGDLVTVTSRSQHTAENDIRYVQGNAHDMAFLQECLEMGPWDAVVDFMVYSTEEFRERVEMLLSGTRQYIFISSARVYARSDAPIREDSPRLLDVCEDQEYLKTDEYALTKARQEDILVQSGHRNWAIIRPSITYNERRLQLGVLEKEHWLYRALHGRTIVFSEDIGQRLTAMTYGEDVARGIASVIGEPEALGEVFHITQAKAYTWREILEVYLDVLEEKTGTRPRVLMTERTTCFRVGWNHYQIVYCRYYDRCFDNSKIGRFVDAESFTAAPDGLRECLGKFLDAPKFSGINWALEGVNDQAAGERTPLAEIPGAKNKVIYLLFRYHLRCLYLASKKVSRCLARNMPHR